MYGPICGGTSRNVDENAPKTIKSENMVFFKANSALHTIAEPEPNEYSWINDLSAYAAKLDGGSFLVLLADDRYGRDERAWAYVKEDIFPELVKAVNEAELVNNNGVSSFTHGLPENFGGAIDIRYDSGETIRYSDNQCPVFGKDFAARLYVLFSEKLKGESVPLPDAERITAIKYDESRSGGYTRAELFKNEDGTYTLKKIYKFEGSEPDEFTETVSEDVLKNIKKIVQDNVMLLWNEFPRNDFQLIINKSLTFVLDDGSEITVKDSTEAPPLMSGAFFGIECELLH